MHNLSLVVKGRIKITMLWVVFILLAPEIDLWEYRWMLKNGVVIRFFVSTIFVECIILLILLSGVLRSFKLMLQHKELIDSLPEKS